jgi:tetratricopeptide (TPR) repeat protein
MSRIEESLLSRIQNSSIERERAMLSSRLAIYYFHKGESERAIKLVDKVRAWLRLNDGLDVMVYINLAEAADLFQSAQTQEAIQKAKRAYALSAASGRRDLVALSAIWLAHLDFNDGLYVDAVRMIGVCLSSLDQSEALARTRCYTLIADILSFCGMASKATPWYTKARAAAVEEGDEIAIGQIIYNSAAIRFNNLRLSHVRGEEIVEELRFLELMISSSSHYDAGVSSRAFKSFLPMLNAQLLMLRGDFKNASRIFALWLQTPDAAVDKRVKAICQADFALSKTRSGDLSQAIEMAGTIELQIDVSLPPDEAAIIYHQRAELFSVAGDAGRSELYTNMVKEELNKHEKVQREIASLLSSELGLVF